MLKTVCVCSRSCRTDSRAQTVLYICL